MEPRNFSSPNNPSDKKREERLNKLRERRNRGVNGMGEVVSRDFSREAGRDLSKVRPLPTRQGKIDTRPEPKPEPKLDSRTELKPKRKPVRPTPLRSPAKFWGWQVLRLAIAGVGLSVIAGTAISFWQSHQQQTLSSKATTAEIAKKEETNAANNDVAPLDLKTEATPLLSKIKELAAKGKDLGMQMMVYELDSGNYVQINAAQPIPAASTIKTPLLVAFLQDVDAGKIKLDEQLEMTADVMVGEAGDFQFQPVGTKFSALETITQMIVISDNTATNMVIKRLGGIAAVNQRFKSWGLNNTVVKNQLPDLEGTNTVSSQDLVTLLSMIDQGKLITPRSRDRFMDIMRRPITTTLLPKGIGDNARIIHKTGDIGMAVGDAGIVDMPNGKRYAIAVMVKRPDNDQRANELIRQISRATYDYFLGSLPAPSNSPTGEQNNNSDNGEKPLSPSPNASPSTAPNTSPSNSQNSSPSSSPAPVVAPEVTRQP
ncbi:MAG: serine hydrolase [Pseudanabaenaceae cyanobacterium bins.39]|nr:serine hydrolase [Pseudanabaenaceae cyanobacterium bins.39]